MSSEKRKRGGENGEKLEKKKPSWVLHCGENLPSMTPTYDRDYHLPMRTIADDEADLCLPCVENGERPCRHGLHCTSVMDIQGGPMVPLKALENSRECLLCHRKGMRAKYVRHTILDETVPKNKLVQRFESPVGADGYREDVCVGRHEKKYNGFISHVAIGTVADYAWVCDPETGKWRVDQSPLYQSFHRASADHQ